MSYLLILTFAHYRSTVPFTGPQSESEPHKSYKPVATYVDGSIVRSNYEKCVAFLRLQKVLELQFTMQVPFLHLIQFSEKLETSDSFIETSEPNSESTGRRH